MNWCSRPRGPRALELPCCGSRTDVVTIDVPDLPKQQLVMSDDSYQYGSLCIDRNGLRRKNEEHLPSKHSQHRSSERREALEAWEQRRLSPEYHMPVASTPRKMGNLLRNQEVMEASAAGRQSRSSMEVRRLAAMEAKRGSGGLFSRGAPMGDRQHVKLEDLVKIKGVSECLGKGVSGTVWKVVDQSIKEVLALKEMELEADEEKCRMIVQEMQMMLDLDHPCIVACHGVFFDKGRFQIVMEFMDAGSLLDLMRAGDHKLPVVVLQGVTWQVLQALVYLHVDKRVIHRDLKPGNILVNRKGQVKLADFGVASRPRDSRDSRCATWVGTVTYMSPERIVGDKYTFNADVWSLGVIVVEAAIGRYPYLLDDSDKKKFEFWDLLDTVTNSPPAASKLPEGTDEEFRSFADYILQKQHDERPDSRKALMHPWLANVPQNVHSIISRWVHQALQDRRTKDAAAISQGMRGVSME